MNGKLLWRYDTGDAIWAEPVTDGESIYVASMDHFLYALDPATGDVHWSYETPAFRMIINVPTPVFHDNRMYLSSFYDGSYMFLTNVHIQ